MSGARWIKITADIFDDEKMYAIETMQDGYLMELVWFKLLCLAGKCNQNGFLCINNKIAYTDEMLSAVFRMEIGTVQRALTLFQTLEMIEVVDNTYMISNWLIHQNEKGLEELHKTHAERQKRYRERQKLLKLEEKESVTSRITSQSDVIPSISISNSYSDSISNIISYLNNSINTNYRTNSRDTVKHIKARLDEGFTEDDFKTVIDKKKSEWQGTEMEKYLRPSTLFGTKFESYLNQNQTSNNASGEGRNSLDDWLNA